MDELDYGYRCEHPGCEKSFTRKDHLIRHTSNQDSQTTYDCLKCNRGFKRQDLLLRHERRNICGEEVHRSSASSSKRPRSDSDDSEPSMPLVPAPPHRPQPLSFANTSAVINGPMSAPLSAISNPNIYSIASGSTSMTSASNMGTGNVAQGIAQAQPNNSTMLAPGNDFVANDFMGGDWGFSLWAPEQWEALLHESLAPPFNEPMMTMPWDMTNVSMLPRIAPQESAEREQNNVASATLVARIQMTFPEFDVPLSWVIEALQNYWIRTAPTFPFIHRGTLDLNTAPPELVVMMAVVGSVEMSPRRDFSQLVSKIRGLLVQGCGLEMPLSTLQAFCLCHVHDTWYSTAEAQFVAQCMWPVMVAHSRKKGIGVVGKPDNEAHQEEAWAAWAKEEERRRAAYCVLLIDTQLSAFWNQHCSRQLSIFAHHLTLPCTQQQWEAPSAQDWFRARVPPPMTPPTPRRAQRSGYLPGLHPEFQVTSVSDGYSAAILAALALEKLSFKVDLDNSLTVQMVLIGLIAIAWDCRTRGGMGIRFREGTKHWRSIVFKAVIALRAPYETRVGRLGDAVESKDLRDTFAICIISILSDIPMLCVAAGSPSFCGSTIGPRQYADAKRRLKLWAKTDDAWTCAWQCARYLRQALFAEWGLYTPWAVFLTTLVCWAHAWTSAREDSNLPAHRLPPPLNPTPDIHLNIVTWLDKVLGAQGRVDTLESDVEDLLEHVAGRLDHGGAIERGNGTLLRRLISGSQRIRR